MPEDGQVLVRVSACAICRTDIHLIDGNLSHPKWPLIPGHEIVGRIASLGRGADRFKVGDRLGLRWLGCTCDECRFWRSGRENLCEKARFTGYTLDGGFAEYVDRRAWYGTNGASGPGARFR
jgi:propanol-preferring alcohol dehydrogenase